VVLQPESRFLFSSVWSHCILQHWASGGRWAWILSFTTGHLGESSTCWNRYKKSRRESCPK